MSTQSRTQTLDSAEFKARQRQEWDGAAGGWKKWWPAIEQDAHVINDHLLEMAGVAPGARVLDVATGIGEPAVTAARRVGRAGRITAVDQSPEMLAIARARSEELGLDNIQFLEMDAEALDFQDETFDAVLSRWGLMLLPNVRLGLMQMHRVLASGGRLAAAVWDVPEQVPLLSTPVAVMRRMMDLPPPPKDAPGLFSLADAALLEQLLKAAGFVDIHTERLTSMVELPSIEDYMQLLKDVSPPVTALLASQSPERQAEVWQAIAEAMRRYETNAGSLRIPSACILAAGRRS